MMGALSDAALGLVGTKFRLHGRDPASGLDCIGLVAEAMRQSGFTPSVPQGYSLRCAAFERHLAHAGASGLRTTDSDADVVLTMFNPVQPHLLVIAGDGFVHAHAGLGRVTFVPGPIPWMIVRQWRVLHTLPTGI